MNQQFDESLGIRLSPEWIELCHTNLKSLSQDNIDSDAILHQVLHFDLRDVVASRSSDREIYSKYGKLLRESILNSILPSMNKQLCDITLPSSFTCLVQVEELVSH